MPEKSVAGWYILKPANLVHFQTGIDTSSLLACNQYHPKAAEFRKSVNVIYSNRYETYKLSSEDIAQLEKLIADFRSEGAEIRSGEFSVPPQLEGEQAEDEVRTISLTRAQYRELLRKVSISDWVEHIPNDDDDDDLELSDKIHSLEYYLVLFAEEFGCGDMMSGMNGEPGLNKQVEDDVLETVDNSEEYAFWNQFRLRMGQRDFRRTITEEESKYIKEKGVFPSRMQECYDKWELEIENHGLGRIEIVDLDL